ncbi:Involved in oxygen transport in the brain. Hexacoordinate globin [Seminavis robusta]|uniref:Involved in oxygen transport in the brain. Hexacoordinate globin n=1 Tax=Seminavis robusta TaxID=568900 RepID=A0A9N8ECI3_9STRA|nr:Involved in oxygen transport in the brain. Hexacoordinate globin [Seminavis robusta]|eukprot:Sro879_g214880.1 Involved in oxygen transport in the brain. Hexacoordinate globin (156) ;mRNA; f:29483-30043
MDSCAFFGTVSEVYDSWERVKRIPDYEETVGIALFDRMFEVAPDQWGNVFNWTRDDFQNKDEKFLGFANKFVRMLDLAVHMLGPDLEIVEEQMHDIGVSHRNYGVLPIHLQLMGESLAHTLQGLLGSSFTPATKQAWKDIFGFWSTSMIQGAIEA